MSYFLEANWPAPHTNNTALCKAQNNWLKELTKEFALMKEKVLTLEKQNAELREELTKLKNSESTVKSNGGNVAPLSFSNMVKRNQRETETELVLLNKAAKEINERNKIEKNVIISGLESINDGTDEEKSKKEKDAVEKIVEYLGTSLTKVEKITKVSKSSVYNENKKLIYQIELKDIETKKAMLSNAKKLSTSENFKNIYLNSDKTAAERALDRELRKERKKRNEKLPEEKIENGKKLRYKIENGKRWYWGIRNERLVLVLHPEDRSNTH